MSTALAFIGPDFLFCIETRANTRLLCTGSPAREEQCVLGESRCNGRLSKDAQPAHTHTGKLNRGCARAHSEHMLGLRRRQPSCWLWMLPCSLPSAWDILHSIWGNRLTSEKTPNPANMLSSAKQCWRLIWPSSSLLVPGITSNWV